MIFLIPFLYLLAETLSYYDSNYTELYIYNVFTSVCKKVNRIKNGNNPQLGNKEISDCLVDVMHFHKLSGR